MDPTYAPFEGPVLEDVDGDGDLEVVMGSGSKVYVFQYDGTPLSGWPQKTLFTLQTSPAVGDIDADGDKEIVVVDRNTLFPTWQGRLYVWHHNGSMASGFPVTGEFGIAGPSLCDLDGDGALEIVVGGRTHIFVFKHDGTLLESWPQKIKNSLYFSVGDVDTSGNPEVIVASDSMVYILGAQGELWDSWPQDVGEGYTNWFSYPTLADVDDDHDLEIMVSSFQYEVGVATHPGGSISGIMTDP